YPTLRQIGDRSLSLPLGACDAPHFHRPPPAVDKPLLDLASGAIAIAGILLAGLLFLGQRRFVSALAKSAPGRFVRNR
ncbi:hypothetical protein HKW80_40920, partial [Pseudomonas aeruginosa]|nr:hypothetical protein [Pseudomonas aeruginosa]